MTAEVFASTTDRGTARESAGEAVVQAGASDHPGVYCFLGLGLGLLPLAEFRSAIEDPFYHPYDRLLVRRDETIVGHVRLAHRTVQFDRLRIPVVRLHELAVAPDRRAQGLGRRLLSAAENQMVAAGASVGLLRTTVPHFFGRHGWALCGRYSYSRADARALLGQLREHGVPCRRRGVLIRPYRLWEQPGLMRVYRQSLCGVFGPLERTEPYWRWLVERRACDQLYVALEGSKSANLAEAALRVAGYAAVRGGQIVELLTLPDRLKVAAELLARCCGDAVEQDRQGVVLHGPLGHPLHRLFDEAGGTYHDDQANRNEVQMAKLLRPSALLRSLGPVLCARAEQAGLPDPTELGLLVDGRLYHLEIAGQFVRTSAQHLGQQYIRLSVPEFTRLVLGQFHWDRALEEDRLWASNAEALRIARTLFPPQPLWHPPLDDLPARDDRGEPR